MFQQTLTLPNQRNEYVVIIHYEFCLESCYYTLGTFALIDKRFMPEEHNDTFISQIASDEALLID